MATTKKQAYTSANIKSLVFPDSVRQNASQYIGGTDAAGLWLIARELLDNGLDEGLAGRNDAVMLHKAKDGSYWVLDRGPGVPQGITKTKIHVNGKDIINKMPTMQAVFGALHTSGKYDNTAYEVSIGTHGIGAKGTNACSLFFKVWTFFDGQWYHTAFEQGKIKVLPTKCKAPKGPDGNLLKRGTCIHFKPDPAIFSTLSFPLSQATEWAEIMSYFNPGFAIIIAEEQAKGVKKQKFLSKNGVVDYIDARLKKFGVESERQYFEYKSEKGDPNAAQVVVAFANYDGCDLRGFTNGLPNTQGGKHVDSVVSALYAGLKPYIKTKKVRVDGKTKTVPAFREADFKEGLVGLVNAQLHKAKFTSQDKAKLSDERMGADFRKKLEAAALDFFKKNKSLALRLCARATKLNELKSKFVMSKAAANKLNSVKRNGLPSKYAGFDPRTKVENRELFIVEGDSAGGCFTGDTKVRLLNGESKRFDLMAEEAKRGIKHYGYAYDIRSQEVVVIEFDEPRITKYTTELVEVELSNGQVIRCTPDHPWLNRTGTYIAAEDLTPGTALMPHTEWVNDSDNPSRTGRREVVVPKFNFNARKGCRATKRGKRVPVFHLAVQLQKAQMLRKKKLELNGIKVNIHHKDYDRLNDWPSNLEVLPEAEHRALHAEETESFANFKSGAENPHSEKMTSDPKYRARVVDRAAAHFSAFWSDPVNRKRQSRKVQRILLTPRTVG